MKVITRLAVDSLKPNGWNMNVLSGAKYEKLKNWISECRKKNKAIPAPVIVRPRKRGYQIIDGYHRWKATRELGYDDIDVWIFDCDDKQAKLLTNSLNYLKGDPDPKKEAVYVQELLSSGLDLDDIVAHTNYDREGLDDLILTSGIEIEEVETLDAEEDEEEAKLPESWVDLKFSVPVSVAEIVEAEIARVSSNLEGKNLRGRALEYMSIMSAQTPLSELEGLKLKKAKSEESKALSLGLAKRKKKNAS